MKLETYQEEGTDVALSDADQPKDSWRWRLIGDNGEEVANSGEPFYSRENAERNFLRTINSGLAAWVAYCQEKVRNG